jgi:succinate-semialdehyde dehydrogenase/glutarate-semialdehyde dehydrogenase
VSNCTVEDFQKAIKSADKAQRSFFESTTGIQRGALLRKWNDLILENLDDSKFAPF